MGVSSMSKTVSEIVTADVDIENLLGHLDFSEETLEQAAYKQPLLFVEACRYRVQRLRRKNMLESELSSSKTQLSLAIRKKSGTGDKRMTERFVEAQILQNDDIMALQDKLSRAEEYEEFSKLLVEAFRHRRDSIRVVQEIRASEMNLARHADEMSNLTKLKSTLRKKYPGKSPADADDGIPF